MWPDTQTEVTEDQRRANVKEHKKRLQLIREELESIIIKCTQDAACAAWEGHGKKSTVCLHMGLCDRVWNEPTYIIEDVQLCDIDLKFYISVCHFDFRLPSSSCLSDQPPLVSFTISSLPLFPSPLHTALQNLGYLPFHLSILTIGDILTLHK